MPGMSKLSKLLIKREKIYLKDKTESIENTIGLAEETAPGHPAT